MSRAVTPLQMSPFRREPRACSELGCVGKEGCFLALWVAAFLHRMAAVAPGVEAQPTQPCVRHGHKSGWRSRRAGTRAGPVGSWRGPQPRGAQMQEARSRGLGAPKATWAVPSGGRGGRVGPTTPGHPPSVYWVSGSALDFPSRFSDLLPLISGWKTQITPLASLQSFLK